MVLYRLFMVDTCTCAMIRTPVVLRTACHDDYLSEGEQGAPRSSALDRRDGWMGFGTPAKCEDLKIYFRSVLGVVKKRLIRDEAIYSSECGVELLVRAWLLESYKHQVSFTASLNTAHLSQCIPRQAAYYFHPAASSTRAIGRPRISGSIS
jgi:hypothetical protein